MSETEAVPLRVEDLPAAIRARRGTMGLRQAAGESGVSAPTLSRLERGQRDPDLTTLQRLSAWLGRPIIVSEQEKG